MSQGLRCRSLLQQKLRRPSEFVEDLWHANDDGGYEAPTFSKPDPRRTGVNQIAVSPVDPDAQMFKKPGKTPLLSHKTHFVVDSRRAARKSMSDAQKANLAMALGVAGGPGLALCTSAATF